MAESGWISGGAWRVATAMALLLVFALIVFPVAWLVLTAFKLPRDVYEIKWLFDPTVENFLIIFQPPWSLGRRIVNSAVVASMTTRRCVRWAVCFVACAAAAWPLKMDAPAPVCDGAMPPWLAVAADISHDDKPGNTRKTSRAP